MENTLILAGRCFADAVQRLVNGGTLVPYVAYEAKGDFGAMPFPAPSLEDGVNQGNAWLEENPKGAQRAVLVYDAMVPIDGTPGDAVIGKALALDGDVRRSLTVVVPYREVKRDGATTIEVLSPRFTALVGVAPADLEKLSDAFYTGVEADEAAAEVWGTHAAS